MRPAFLRRVCIFLSLLAAIAGLYFLFPFGVFPRPASPNCGPERWRWLDVHPKSAVEFVDYLRAHELELLNGSQLPRLDGRIFPDEIRLGESIDYDLLLAGVQVNERIGYTIFTLTYAHPACGEYQRYTLKITSFGFASLYGCCGV